MEHKKKPKNILKRNLKTSQKRMLKINLKIKFKRRQHKMKNLNN